MSRHLGDLITALVDCRLDAAAREQVLCHLLDCEECRAEADAQRTLKRELAGLPDVPAVPDALHARLVAVAEVSTSLTTSFTTRDGATWSGGWSASLLVRRTPRAPRRGSPWARTPWTRTDRPTTGPTSRPTSGSAGPGFESGGTAGPGRTPRRRSGRRPPLRRRIAVAGSLSIGAATFVVAFAVGGQPAGPALSPPSGSYTVEHVATRDSVPLTDPASGAVSVALRPTPEP